MKLICIHIPKTAGRSFNIILQNVYGRDKVCYLDRKDVIAAGKRVENIIPENAVVLHGHFKFPEIRRWYKKQRTPLIAWVRHPVERVISNYYFFIKRIRSGAVPHNYHRRDETLMEYARLKECRNVMSQFLKGLPLKNIFFVGVLEHFSEDVEDLSKMLNWRPVTSVTDNSNRAYKSLFDVPEPEERAEILHLNMKDWKRYEEALSLRKYRLERVG